MRYMQLKHYPNTVVKRWAVASTLSFAGILLGGAITGVDVHADSNVVGTSDTTDSSVMQDQDQDQSVTTSVTIQSNLGAITVNNVTGNKGQTVTVTVPAKIGYKADKSMVVANVNNDGTITTDEAVNYTAVETDNDQSGFEPTSTYSLSSTPAENTENDANTDVADQENGDTSDETPDTSNIVYSGQFGTSDWTIEDTGENTVVLHIGAGELGSTEKGNAAYWRNSSYVNSITSIQIDGPVKANTDSSYLFYKLKNVTQFNGLNNLDTSDVTNMQYMFANMSSIEDLDLSSFDTSDVTDMYSMFMGMSSVKKLNLSSFDTSKVTTMAAMFLSMSSIEDLDLSSFDTSKVTSMISMFSGMTSVKDLDLSSFDTSKVTSMISMFRSMVSVKDLELSSFNTSNVTNMSFMFAGASSLKTLDISNFDMFFGPITQNMFSGTKIYKLKLGERVFLDSRFHSFAGADPKYYAVGNGNENNPEDEDKGELTNVESKYRSPAEDRNNEGQLGKFNETYVRPVDATLGSVPYSDGSQESYEIKESAHGVPGNEVTADIEIPEVEGYTLYKNGTRLVANDNGKYLVTISGTIEGPDDNNVFNVSTDDYIEYRQNPVSGTVTIPSNYKDPVEVEVSGEKGTTVTVDVPEYPGYTADKKTVEVAIDKDGNFSVVDPEGAGHVTYTKNPTHNGGGSSTSTPTSEVTDVNIDVATFADRPEARLYNTQGQLITNRALRPNTCWFADKKLTRNGVSYYRVATGEWVELNDVYVYTANNKFIKTYNDSSKDLLNAHQVRSGRQLRANSDWVTDIFTYMNGTKYYRVGSNEFVSADDALEYTPIHAVVQTNNYNVTIYNERGNAVTNRQLTANSSWITDKTAVINGLTMYRVATDEWIKAVDVLNVKEN